MKRLYRSRTNRIIAGVCGGIAEYTNIDPTVVRLLWLLVSLIWGAGIVAYIIALIIIPEEPTI
jgi:phage shock protein C